MRKLWLSLCSVFLLAPLLWVPEVSAETATVMGQVTYRDNKPSVNLLVSVGDRMTVTDSQGRYLLKNVPYGRYTLLIKENKKNGKVLKQRVVDVRQPRLQFDERLP